MLLSRPLRCLPFAALVALLAGCSSDPASTTTGSSSSSGSGSGGAGGSGGTGGMGGFVCSDPGVGKGPWSLHIDDASAAIRWEACREGTSPEVIVTPEAGGAEIKVTAAVSSFEVTETHTAPFLPDAPPDAAGTYYMHEATITGLAQGTCYGYHLAADPARKGRLCTARAPAEPFSFMAIGDTNPGLGDYAKNVLAHALPKNPDFTVHGGDIQYYESGLETWASWFPPMQPMLSQGGFFPAIGNHESEKPNELETYLGRFFGGAGFDGTKDYYRFQWGGVWFFSLNTEIPIDPGSEQGGWLAAQLADAHEKPDFRFSVVYFHRPLVTCGDTGDNPDARAKLEPIFQQYGVTLILQAHMHGYERFELGPFTYITSAGGGGKIGNVDENDERAYCTSRVASGGFRHAVIFTVKPGELSGEVIDDQGMIRDTFTKVVP